MGAEASIDSGEYLGIKAVFKRRMSKGYRLPELDRKIIESRTRNEVRCIIAAREGGVHVPWVLDVDDREGLIVMEYIEGERMSTLLYAMDNSRRVELERLVGAEIARLHSAGIAHGDLTTSNIICGEHICFIDFSMASRNATVEQLGVDFRLLHEVYRSTHAQFEDEFNFILDGYIAAGGSMEVIKRMKEIERRARYV